MGTGRKASEPSCGRGVPGSEGVFDQQEKEQEEQQDLIRALTGTLHHFFIFFPQLFANVTDPRDPQKILYPPASLAFAGVMMFLFQLKSRRQIGLLLRNGPSVRKFHALFGVDRFPHGDTLEATFSNLETDQIQTVVTGMTESLIRKEVLYSYRLLGIYIIVAIDGSG
jgi:hypothetical protein